MTGARMSTLASLRKTIGRLEGETDGLVRVALGHAEADATLHGGLVRGALHEVFAEGGRNAAAATRLHRRACPSSGGTAAIALGAAGFLPRSNPARCRSEAWLSWGWTRAYWSSSELRMPRRRSA